MRGKVNLPQFFSKKNWGGGGFLKFLLSNNPRLKILADLGEGFFGKKKKRFLVMGVYRSNCTQLHLENTGRRFYDNTRGSLKNKWLKE